MARKRQTRKSVLSVFQQDPVQTLATLRKASSLPPEEIREQLSQLISENLVIPGPRGRFFWADSCVQGEIDLKESGIGFVDIGQGQDVILKPPATRGLLPGDRVLVALKPGKNRQKAVFVRIVSRSKTLFTGVVRAGFVRPDDPALGKRLRLKTNGQSVQDNTRISFRVSASKKAKLVRVLGPADDPKTDTAVVMARFGLEEGFPRDVLREAEALMPLKPDDIGRRRDLRGLLSITIDPRGSSDFDDAFSIRRDQNGWELMVHIADVAHYVAVNSALDRQAGQRGTSVYLLDKVVPMLPDRLSSDLASLLPGQLRPTVSICMFYGPKGQFKRAEFCQSVIKTGARLTYQDAENLLQGREPGDPDTVLLADKEEIREGLLMAQQLARLLRSTRTRMGFIDLELPEPQFVFDEDGRVIDVRPGHQGFSHKIVEEFMIAADRAVATEFQRRRVHGILRVHPRPDPEKLREFARISSGGLGEKVPEQPNPADIARVLEKARSTPLHQVLSYHLLRSLKRAEYSVEAGGHFGLALKSYLHFTSPIRRYPDLVNHRILKALIAGEKPPYSKTQLAEIAQWCSRASRNADKAQWELWDMKKARFMEDKLGQVFTGVVSGVMASGLFVTIQKHLVEGFVRVPGCVFSVDRGVLLCGKTAFGLGKSVKVKVVSVNLDDMKIDMEMVGRDNKD